jgi:hypothetical protein
VSEGAGQLARQTHLEPQRRIVLVLDLGIHLRAVLGLVRQEAQLEIEEVADGFALFFEPRRPPGVELLLGVAPSVASLMRIRRVVFQPVAVVQEAVRADPDACDVVRQRVPSDAAPHASPSRCAQSYGWPDGISFGRAAPRECSKPDGGRSRCVARL